MKHISERLIFFIFTEMLFENNYLKPSICFYRADDTTELMEEAAQVAPCSAHLDSADTTEALLKTFTLVDPSDGDTCCLTYTEPPQHFREQQLGSEVQKKNLIDVISGIR